MVVEVCALIGLRGLCFVFALLSVWVGRLVLGLVPMGAVGGEF